VHDSDALLPVIAQPLVEQDVLLLCNIRGVTYPEGLGLVEHLVLNSLLLDLLGLLLIVLVLVSLLFLGSSHLIFDLLLGAVSVNVMT
jgi:hypothetical protein